MAFFDEVADLDEFVPPEPRRKRWRGDSDDTLGVPVALADFLVRTEDLAVMVSGLVAFPAGFTVDVVALSRLDPPKGPMDLIGHHHPFERAQAPEELFRFGIGFSDDTKVLTDRQFLHRPGGDPAPRRLQARGGGGGGRRFNRRLWCEPLPPAGPMRFVCRWLAHGIEETEVVIDAGLILDAAARATTIWPEDVGLPEDDPAAGRRALPSIITSRMVSARATAEPGTEGDDEPGL